MSPGTIFLASKTQLPIVCCTYGFQNPWRLNSWDRCIIPKPFSRARAIYSRPVSIPARLDREGIEHYRFGLENLMNALTIEAEQWAEDGVPKPNEYLISQSSMDRRIQEEPQRFQTPLSPTSEKWVDFMESYATSRVRKLAA
jgi:hypothetical protein